MKVLLCTNCFQVYILRLGTPDGDPNNWPDGMEYLTCGKCCGRLVELEEKGSR